MGVPESFDEHFKIMFDLQVLAFTAEITRFIRKAASATDSMWPRTTPTIGRTWINSP